MQAGILRRFRVQTILVQPPGIPVEDTPTVSAGFTTGWVTELPRGDSMVCRDAGRLRAHRRWNAHDQCDVMKPSVRILWRLAEDNPTAGVERVESNDRNSDTLVFATDSVPIRILVVEEPDRFIFEFEDGE